MTESMLRVAKREGVGNVILEEVPIPKCGPRDVLIRNKISLISRGSEILERYMKADAVDASIMGYSVGGVVEHIGEEALKRFKLGDRVTVSAPHAQYVLRSIDAFDGTAIWPIPDDLSFEHAAFIPLCLGGVMWAEISGIKPGDTVVIMGQGLVGNLVMQAARLYMHERMIVVDAIDRRCKLATELGADVAINATNEDPVEKVKALTHGRGAQVVIDCVGGKAGVESFVQAQEMVCNDGTLHLIGLYHGQPVPLDAGKIQRRKLIGGYYGAESREVMLPRTIENLQSGRMRIEPLISHRFNFNDAKQAYDMLYERMSEAMGVLLEWE